MILTLLVFYFMQISKSDNEHTHSYKTYKGKEVRIETVPYTITTNYGCTGVLIRPEWVLTARHCVVEGMSVGLGTEDAENIKYSIQVKKIYLQPNNTELDVFHPFQLTKEDIALLKLSKPARLSEFIQPIKIERIEWPNGMKNRRCTLAGYSFNINKDFILHQTEFYAYYQEYLCNCNESLGIVCAESIQKGDSICFGDSGGALICDNKAVAITSMLIHKGLCGPSTGRNVWDSMRATVKNLCQNDTLTSIFTHIYPHLTWIDKILPGLSLRSYSGKKGSLKIQNILFSNLFTNFSNLIYLVVLSWNYVV